MALWYSALASATFSRAIWTSRLCAPASRSAAGRSMGKELYVVCAVTGNTKTETPTIRQLPISRHQTPELRSACQHFEVWVFEFLWSLELGVGPLISQSLVVRRSAFVCLSGSRHLLLSFLPQFPRHRHR